jgi:hypothetical protein
MFGKLDIWCIQEHKLCDSALDSLGSKLWRTAKTLCCEATLGNQGSASRGGLAMLVSPKIQYLISRYEEIGMNQAQRLTLSGLPGRELNIVNLYAPNIAAERITLWQALVSSLLLQGRWVFCGDWNMVELVEDKSSPEGRILARAERLEFENFKAHFQI